MMTNRLDALTKYIVWLAPWLIPMLFVVLEIQHHAPNFAISNLDYFPLVERALRLSFSSAAEWVNWLHPVGFSWLVRLGLQSGFDAARFGQALSILGGVLGLIGAYALGWAVSGSRAFALVGQLFTVPSDTYLFYGAREGNDMLAAGLQVLALGILSVGLVKSSAVSTQTMQESMRNARDDVPAVGWVVGSALAAGLSYLIRYTGMITVAACMLLLITIALIRRKRQAWKMAGLYLAIVVIVTAIQWVPSWMVTGSPMSNDQGQNVWFYVYGKSDFLTQWNEAPQNITVLQVFQMNPGKFIRYWWKTFQAFWLSPQLTLLADPLKLFGMAGIVFMLLAGYAIRWSVRLLIAAFMVLHVGALSLIRLDPRYLILQVPLLTIGAVYLFWRILPQRWHFGKVVLPVQALACVVGLLLTLPAPLGFASTPSQVESNLITASDVLHSAGMNSPSEVLSTHLQLQDLSSRSRTRFTQAFYQTLPHTSVEELLNAARQQQFRFLIYDREAGPKIYPMLTNLLRPEAHLAGLTPIYVEPNRQFVIYRIEDAEKSTTQPMATLEHGLGLIDYEVHASQPVTGTGRDRDVGVTLRWQTDRVQTVSYKVFVHIVDEAGQLLAQDDSIPAQWLYPVTDWKPGEPVSDFHLIRLRGIDPDKPYTVIVGLYDGNTGQRLKRLDAHEQVVDDKVILPKGPF